VGTFKVKDVPMVINSNSFLKEGTSLPTVSVESLLLSCVINALQGRDVGTYDIPDAFMQADSEEELRILFKGELVYLLLQPKPSFEQYDSKSCKEDTLCQPK
jgi:hypothetical protein